MIQIPQPTALSPGRLSRLEPRLHAHPHAGPIVYYLRNLEIVSDSPVKIGTTSNLPLRAEQLQRDTGQTLGLIAWEPGGRDLERRRHRQFASTRIAGSEWFWLSFPLMDHCDALGAPTGSYGDCLHECPPDCPGLVS